MPCSLCCRDTESLEKHHFEAGRRKKSNEGIAVCHQCGDQLHLMFTNRDLRTKYNSLEKILADPKVQKYIEWVKGKPVETHYTMKKKKRV
jgi:hypothetical protein